jgi:Tfp pilus assembly protein PilF
LLSGLVSLALLSVGTISGCATGDPRTPSSDQATTDEQKITAYVEASSLALNNGDLTSALSYALQAEKVDPSNSSIEHLKALIFSARGERSTAIECARKAVSLDPKSAGANNTLGKLLIDDGHGDEAEPYLLLAAHDPLNREAYKAWTNLGISYYRKLEYTKSVNAMDHAIASSPMNACVAFYYRGHVRMTQGKIAEAIQDYDSSTKKFCAAFADGRLALGIAYERDRQFEKARRTYLEVLDRFKDNPKLAEQASNHLKNLP